MDLWSKHSFQHSFQAHQWNFKVEYFQRNNSTILKARFTGYCGKHFDEKYGGAIRDSSVTWSVATVWNFLLDRSYSSSHVL